MNEEYHTNLINIRFTAVPFFRDIENIFGAQKIPKKGEHTVRFNS